MFRLAVALLVTWVACGCNLRVGPFVPDEARPCGNDYECRDHEACRFPAVDTHAVCMPVGVEVGGEW